MNEETTEPVTRDPIDFCLRTTLLGILINALLAATKGIAGVLGNSYALIADAIESTTDIFSSLVVYAGIKISSIPRDSNHPYGHGKAEPIAAILVSMGLYTAAIAITIQSFREILTPHHSPESFTLVVLVLVVLVKETLYRYVHRVGEAAESIVVQTDAWHHRSDAITSAAAFVGISLALIGGDGFESADDYAALFASGIIIFNATRLIRPALAEVMDSAPTSGVETAVRETALSVEGVRGVDLCLVRKMGFDFYVDLHVVVDDDLTVREGHWLAHKVKDALMESNPRISDVLIHVEPVTIDPRYDPPEGFRISAPRGKIE
ncbi:MAG: cation transporter [Candidatus Omnitrophica bacterium]|nr:cation transporter [Candidatus Omnitrophota bacterium]MCB9784814.1 cation transporter [Candidatus Omnitrophota bacterium]